MKDSDHLPSDFRYTPDSPSVNSTDAAFLFVYHLAQAISYWEITADEKFLIKRNAENIMTSVSYRRALHSLLFILDHIWKEPE